MDSEKIVEVALAERTYQVKVVASSADPFGSFAKESLAKTWAGKSCRRGLIITDENVAGFVKPLADSLREYGIATTVASIPEGESSKSLHQASGLYDRLIELRADRHFAIFAVGGGVVGDLAGYVAATFMRGIPLVMVPTSLLAQVDSSVGGKVGVNHPQAKNIIGAFHQPVGVWVDVNILHTLPIRELRCGLAEVVKYGVILDPEFFSYLETHAEPILARDPETLRHLVARSCQLKADVVTQDEREETGLRAILNFGHTIGHAIESVAGYGGPYKHGEAVAIGMTAESQLAENILGTDPDVTTRIKTLLERFGLPTCAPGLDKDSLLQAMTRDKKNRDGKTRFILPRRIGRVELTELAGREDIQRVLDVMESSS